MIDLRYALSVMAFAALQLGCSTEPRPADATAKGNGGWIPIDEAVQKLASERCNRELSCTNAGGQGHQFSNGEACMHELHRSTKAEYGATACSLAIEGRKLDECIEAVHAKGCENTLEAVTRIPACRAEAICVQLSRGSMGG